MASMTLKTIVFQKKNISTSQFCSFCCLFVTWSRSLKVKDDIIYVKGLVLQNIMFLTIRFEFTGFDTGFSQKK